MSTRFDEITARLQAELPPGRFRHTLGVLHSAMMLGARAGADLQKIESAALLHDCAKGMGREEIETAITTNRIAVDPVDMAYPAILHGPVGAWIAVDRFRETDSEVLEAIANHSVGSRKPSLTLQVLMAADYADPTRDFPGIDECRTAVRRDLREGLIFCLQRKREHIESRGRQVHPRMVEMIDCLSGKGGN